MVTTGKDIARNLKMAYALMHRQTQSLLSKHDMTSEQYVLLANLNIEDGVTQQELTRRAASDPNTVRAMLVLLERKGLVARRSHDTDRRARRVLVTAKGRRKYKQLASALAPLQHALRAPFSEQEAKVLVDALQRFCDAIRQWESDPDAHKNK
jgi:DNA-binding MarR family transcriptional regulator